MLIPWEAPEVRLLPRPAEAAYKLVVLEEEKERLEKVKQKQRKKFDKWLERKKQQEENE